jgi:ribonucleoside-diphosphate reductase alpha subunit
MADHTLSMSPPNNNTNPDIFSQDDEMYVLKRNGNSEIVSFNKILKRIKTIGNENNIKINYTSLAMKVIDQLFNNITTTQIDNLTAEQCASMASIRPEYNNLAALISISNHHKNTDNSFFNVTNKLYNYHDKLDKHCPLITKDFFDTVSNNKDFFENIIDYNRDYLIDYFGFKTLERAYLMKLDGLIIERPQHMWLRVSIGIHGNNLEAIKESYDLMSQKYFTHGTPTLFNAGTNRPQLSSCFLLCMSDDSIKGIYETLTDCALISKWAGGIGLHIHNVRASGSQIRGTNGTSNGIVPMLRVFNNTAKYVDQCVHPDTIVYTKQGAKKIKNIVIGDKVVTDDGNYYKIGKILDYEYYGDLYILDVKHTLMPIKLTDMHPLWVIPNNTYYQRNFKDIINQLEHNLLVPEFIEVKKIDKNDFIGFPIPKYEKDIEQYTEDDCRFYGIMLGDGNISSVNNLAYVSLNKDTKKDTMTFVENYLTNLNIHITYTYYDKCVRLTWSRTNMFKFTYEMLYDANKEKYVMPNMLHLPKPKILNIIKGVLETDGKVTDHQIVLEITSLSIVESIRYILLRLGILTSGSVRDRTNESHISKYGSLIQNKQISYILIVPKKQIICDLFKNKKLTISGSFTFFEYKGYLFSIVNKNECIRNYSGRVIDIEVDNNYHHNFLTHNGLVKNGGGKRNGSFAIYLEPWHADVELFLEMRKNHGDEELKARDLFYALWIPDLFMERVKSGGNWTLMCPDECPGLSDCYGDEFNKLYEKYELENRGKKTIEARKLWFAVLDAQMETGTPYLLYKDAVNNKSNQKNVGVIKSSNLCTEITEYSDKNETAVCNLASISLPSFIEGTEFNYDKLHKTAKVITNNLNNIIDVNFYPTDKAYNSNKKHRPIGIGVQGLADVFMKLNLPFHSDEAKIINKHIFETIYHGALEKSCELAKLNEPYSTFQGSPASSGILQFDMWNVRPSNRYDWPKLKNDIIHFGLRNSLLCAPMPTASTSQILGNNECFEPITSNIYNRRTNAGEFIVANKYMMKDLIDLGIWNEDIKNNIIANQGSIQHIQSIPDYIRDKYKTVWEIPMKHVLDMAADRGAFICQSQSLNLWLEEPNYNNLTSMHFYGWKLGLKTGIYYLRRRAAHQAQQFTIEPKTNNNNNDDDEICEMCSG